jgi:hypothetical protein
MNHFDKFYEEIANARKYHDEKNEGKSRVCARRAAGFAINAAYAQRDIRVVDKNAMNLIKLLKTEPALPAAVRQALDDLVLRVTPEYDLPGKIDLISSAITIADFLFPMETQTETPQ